MGLHGIGGTIFNQELSFQTHIHPKVRAWILNILWRYDQEALFSEQMGKAREKEESSMTCRFSWVGSSRS